MIKRKTSECVGCGKVRQIYAKHLCPYCYEKQRKKTPLPPPKKKIRKFSKKSLGQLKRYRILRDKYLEENPICQYPGCTSRATDLHHGAGRIGELLTDVKYFRALCRQHHDFIEVNPALAKSLGLSFSRLNTNL